MNITGHSLELLKGGRFVNWLHGNELDTKDNEEETVQMETLQRRVAMMKFSVGVNLM